MQCVRCKICDSDSRFIGKKKGALFNKNYKIFECKNCGFFFVQNSSLEYEKIYNEDYYTGKGADKLVDYVFEAKNAHKSIRNYEFDGIYHLISDLIKTDDPISWLDYGCGAGNFVTYLSKKNKCNSYGFEQGHAVDFCRENNVRLIDEKSDITFDVITSVEVLEHVNAPRAFIEDIKKRLKKGGIFFFTTGNSEMKKNDIRSWNYLIPEIHISLYNPKCINELFKRAGLKYRELDKKEKSHYKDIYKYKVLKNLGIKRKNFLFSLVPWGILSRMLDKKFQLTHFGIGIK